MRTNTLQVEGIPLAETEMIDDGYVAGAGVRSTVPSQQVRGSRRVATLPALTPRQAAIKRFVDLVGASIGLVVLSPLLALLAILVAAIRPVR